MALCPEGVQSPQPARAASLRALPTAVHMLAVPSVPFPAAAQAP